MRCFAKCSCHHPAGWMVGCLTEVRYVFCFSLFSAFKFRFYRLYSMYSQIFAPYHVGIWCRTSAKSHHSFSEKVHLKYNLISYVSIYFIRAQRMMRMLISFAFHHFAPLQSTPLKLKSSRCDSLEAFDSQFCFVCSVTWLGLTVCFIFFSFFFFVFCFYD